jgi:hypothetical protein
MKRPLLLTAILACAVSTLTQAQTENPLIGHIPADADKVYHVNYTAIAAKLDIQSLAPVIFKNPKEQRMAACLIDPAKAGVDPRFGFIIAESNTAKPDSPRYTTIIVPLSDSAKFIKFIRDDNDPAKDGKLTIHSGKPRTATQGKAALAWNDKIVVITLVKAPMVNSNGGQPKVEGMQQPNPAALAKYLRTATHRSVTAISTITKTMTPADGEFRAALANEADADAHIFSRFGSGFGILADIMKMSKAPVNKDFVSAMDNLKKTHMYSIGTIRFDNGKMGLRSRFFSDSLAGLDLGLRPIDASLIQRLPQGNVLGLFAVHIDPVAYGNMMMKRMGTGMAAKGMHVIDSTLAKKGLTPMDILTAFKGDLLVAVIDNGSTIPATDSTPAKPGKPSVYIALTIANKASFDKIDHALHLTRDSAAAAADTSVKMKLHLAHTLRDDILVFGPSQQATDSYANNTGHADSRLLTEEVRTAPVAIAIDVKAIGSYLQPTLGKNPKTAQLQVVFQLLDQIVITAGKSNGKEVETLFEIKMSDKDQNSLTTISKFIQSMSKH